MHPCGLSAASHEPVASYCCLVSCLASHIWSLFNQRCNGIAVLMLQVLWPCRCIVRFFGLLAAACSHQRLVADGCTTPNNPHSDACRCGSVLASPVAWYHQRLPCACTNNQKVAGHTPDMPTCTESLQRFTHVAHRDRELAGFD